MALINKVEILKHRKIDKSVRDEKINPFIDDAEYLDLKPLLGDELYSDLVKNQTQTKYADLLNGKTYDYDGIEYEFKGLKKVLSIFSFARYSMFGSYTHAPFGVVEKNYKDSRSLDTIEKKSLYTKERQAAIQYFNDIVKFLDRNNDAYLYWRYDNSGCVSPYPSQNIRISKIS